MSRATIDRHTRLCVSLSARPGNFGTRFHNHLYDELGLNYIYKAFAVKDLPGAITGLRALGVRGAGVSMPFKEAALALVDSLDESAQAIGALNTIVRDEATGHLRGYNTDYLAVRRLLERHGVPTGTRFALRGAGGMAKAVAAALRDGGFRAGTIVARHEGPGRALASAYGFDFATEVPEGAGLLLNATPIGMEGGKEATELAFAEPAIAAAEVVFDMVALPEETPLVRAARARGKRVIVGGEVLVLQGVEQFVLYTGVRPDASQIARAADVALAPAQP
jgi:shikimate dehydrogenase